MTGKYQSYTETKESGIPWVLNELPAHWEVLPAYSVLRDEQIKNVDGKETNVLSLSYGNIKIRNVENNSGLLPESFNTYQLVWPGDIILRLTDLQNDKRSLRVGRSSLSGIITSAYLKLKASKRIDDRYLYRLLHSYDTSKVFYGMGGGLRQSLKFEDFRRLPIVVPTLNEQRAIANFLDHETAKIDALIDKQEKLIELLKEKRQAVISHAVTKGLNPDVPMKDSGIEWLGEVPISWRKTQLRYEVTQFGGGTPSKDNQSFWEGEIPWVSPKDMKTLYIHQTIDNISESAVSDSSVKLIPEGCVLIVVRGMILAHSVPVAKTMKQVTVNQDMKALKPHRYLNSDFLLWLLVGLRDLVLDLVETSAHGTKCLRTQDFERLAIFLPDLKEQENIVNGLVTTVTQIDNTIEKSKKQIALLKEKRGSLISSAVTGKIDVRNWQPPKTEVSNA